MTNGGLHGPHLSVWGHDALDGGIGISVSMFDAYSPGDSGGGSPNTTDLGLDESGVLGGESGNRSRVQCDCALAGGS